MQFAQLMNISVTPFIDYIPSGDMISSSLFHPFIPGLAYCNLRAQYLVDERGRTTGQIRSASTEQHGKLESILDEAQEAWKTNEACARLKSALETEDPHMQCSRIVAFALGTIDGRKDRRDQRARFQHALLLTLRESLTSSHRQEQEMLCYA